MKSDLVNYFTEVSNLNEPLMLPDEQCGCYQHHGQVHRHRRLEVEPLEVGGGVADTDEEERGQECCQQLIS